MTRILYLITILFLLSFTFYEGEVPTKAEDISPLLVGETVPSVKLSSLEGKTIDILEKVKEKPSIIVFYRGSWCPFCNRQLSGLQKVEKDIADLGYQLIAISPDKAEKLQKVIDKNDLTYTLLSDSKMEVAKAFGVAFQLAEKTLGKYKTFGINLEKASDGGNKNLLPVPSVFVLDKKGTIKFEYINPNYKERLNPDLLLFAAKLALEK